MTPFARLAAWQARATPRERVLVGAAVAILAAAAVWAAGAPLARASAAAETQLASAQRALHRARADAAAVAARADAVRPADLRAAAESALAAHGLRGAVTAFAVRDGRLELTFEAVDFAALTALVDTLRRDARAFPVDVLLVPRTAAGSVRAELAFAVPRPR